MTRFLARRLLNYIVLLILASFLTFTLTSVLVQAAWTAWSREIPGRRRP